MTFEESGFDQSMDAKAALINTRVDQSSRTQPMTASSDFKIAPEETHEAACAPGFDLITLWPHSDVVRLFLMVAQAKRHKTVRAKAPRRHGDPAPQAPESPGAAIAQPQSADEILQDDEEPKPEDLAKEEEALKATEEAEETAIAPEAEEPLPARGRERTSYDGDTAIKLYLREIGQVKLLTPQEEIELAARIKKGDKKAREQMIKANLRLVVKIARDYEGIGLPLLDLISEGNIGLMKAVERFDPAKGGKLSTYGSWWIKQSIKRALANQSKTIRLPVHLVDKISKMRRTSMRLQEELGREPTDEELGEELGITASRVAQMRMAAIRPASLDAPIGDEDSNNFAEVVQDESADTPYEQLEEKTVTRMLQEMVKTLDPREATILRARFGLDGGPQKTLEEVGEKFGVTRERVRQIQNIALKKLRKMIEKMEATRTEE
jgi:RNA polymerase primary sigma factor